MPRYVYNCSLCGCNFQVRHGMNETQEKCLTCLESGYLTRIPQMPSIKRNEEQNAKTGSLTKDYIEQNRELLRDMKRDARNQEYDD